MRFPRPSPKHTRTTFIKGTRRRRLISEVIIKSKTNPRQAHGKTGVNTSLKLKVPGKAPLPRPSKRSIYFAFVHWDLIFVDHLLTLTTDVCGQTKRLAVQQMARQFVQFKMQTHPSIFSGTTQYQSLFYLWVSSCVLPSSFRQVKANRREKEGHAIRTELP